MLSIIIDLIKSGICLFTKNKTEVAKSKDELETEKTNEAQETNREEIKAGRGWRSFLGYACTFILVYNYILVPILDYFGIVLFSFPLSDIIRIIVLLLSGN
ncbi:holin family protein [Enterobacter cloacae]|uniref:holin family protein n=1 Tax=Enterobacter cloacae TaxID=550 RepID=UPI001E43532D|nr:holin family protein [Enterobacter cloacae]MCE1971160.1 holin family protein [Enterobacter cloacae]